MGEWGGGYMMEELGLNKYRVWYYSGFMSCLSIVEGIINYYAVFIPGEKHLNYIIDSDMNNCLLN